MLFLIRCANSIVYNGTRYLLQCEAIKCINQRDNNGETPLFASVTNDESEHIVKCLVANGADLNVFDNYQNNLLHNVVNNISCNGDLRFTTLKYLIECGLSINHKNTSEETPLHTLFICHPIPSKQDLQFARYLIDHGADANITSSNHGRVLELAVTNFKWVDLLPDLLMNEADPNLVDKKGNNSLHLVISKATILKDIQIEIVKLLMEFGANISAPNKEGKTPLDLAKQIFDDKTIEYMDQNRDNYLDFLIDVPGRQYRCALKRYEKLEKQNSVTMEDLKKETRKLREQLWIHEVHMQKGIKWTPKLYAIAASLVALFSIFVMKYFEL